jgi:penicillin amidase
MAWDRVLHRNSIAAAVYVAWERELAAEARRRFVPAKVNGLVNLQLSTLIHWLREPAGVFDRNPLAERDEFLMSCFTKAVDGLTRKFGSDMQGWMYGQPGFKHVRIEHPLSPLLDSAMRRKADLGPLPRGGYGHTPGSTGAADNQTSGASFRFIADLSDWDKAVFTNTPGQSGDPESAFYSNLFEEWANDRYFPAPYSRKAVLEHSFQRTMLNPAVKGRKVRSQ